MLLKIRCYTSRAVANDSDSTTMTYIHGALRICPLIQAWSKAYLVCGTTRSLEKTELSLVQNERSVGIAVRMNKTFKVQVMVPEVSAARASAYRSTGDSQRFDAQGVCPTRRHGHDFTALVAASTLTSVRQTSGASNSFEGCSTGSHGQILDQPSGTQSRDSPFRALLIGGYTDVDVSLKSAEQNVIS